MDCLWLDDDDDDADAWLLSTGPELTRGCISRVSAAFPDVVATAKETSKSSPGILNLRSGLISPSLLPPPSALSTSILKSASRFDSAVVALSAGAAEPSTLMLLAIDDDDEALTSDHALPHSSALSLLTGVPFPILPPNISIFRNAHTGTELNLGGGKSIIGGGVGLGICIGIWMVCNGS